MFTSLYFATVIFLQSKLVSPVSNPPPYLEGQVPVFMSPGDRVAQLYPQAPGSLSITLYGSQGYGGGNLTCFHKGGGFKVFTVLKNYVVTFVLTMEAVCSSKTLVPTYETRQCRNPQDTI
jgi:hypothetical protein